MVALIVSLKLTLLRNSLRRSPWRTVGLVLGLVYALAVVVGVVTGLVALRWTSVGLTAEVTVVACSLLTLGWLVMSLLVFGVDETVDPSRFALLPVRARELLPGLLVAGLVSIPGVATVLVALGLVACWTRGVGSTLAVLVAAPLGVVTCFLLARTATTAFASFLASRRFRDVAAVALALTGAVLGIGVNVVTSAATRSGGLARSALAGTAGVLEWTPFGWAWSLPADVARGRWAAAGVHLVLALALVAGLWWVWGRFLDARLVEPVEPGAGPGRVRGGDRVRHLYPATPAGAIAGRTLRYWRRDPRYVGGAAGLLIAPVVLVVSQLIGPAPQPAAVALAPALLALLIGVSVAQDLSYDGSAVWLHISTGVSGAADRTGRVLSVLTVFAPLLLVLLVSCLALSGRWDLLAPVLALTAGLGLTGMGVGSLVGALWQWPAPPPGANPFSRGSSGGLPALLTFAVTTAGTVLLGLPVIGLVVWSFWRPWLGWVALGVGLLGGAAVLHLGIRLGGRLLERRWPQVMSAVSERAA